MVCKRYYGLPAEAVKKEIHIPQYADSRETIEKEKAARAKENEEIESRGTISYHIIISIDQNY